MVSNYPNLDLFNPSTAAPGMEYRAVYVQDIPYLRESELNFIFREYGTIVFQQVINNAFDARHHSAVITYSTGGEARTAVRESHGLRIDRGPSMNVSYWPLGQVPIPGTPQSNMALPSPQIPVATLGSGSRAITVAGPPQIMSRVLIHEVFRQWGNVIDVELHTNPNPQAPIQADVIFETEGDASRAVELTNPHGVPNGYRISNEIPTISPVSYDQQTDRTIYVGNVPMSIRDDVVAISLSRHGLLSKIVRLIDNTDDITYFKVRFGRPEEAANALNAINQRGIPCCEEARAATSLVLLRQNLLMPVLSPRRNDRRPGAPNRVDPIIIRHPSSKKRIQISGLNITSAGAEETVYNTIRFYDDPGTSYGFINVRFNPNGREAIVACKTNACAILNANRMLNENFGGTTTVDLDLIE